MSHDPEVLRALGERLRRSRVVSELDAGWTFGDEVHEIPREELVRAHDDGILELDRFATGVLMALGEDGA